jgi:hypothetical protein
MMPNTDAPVRLANTLSRIVFPFFMDNY